MLIESLTLFYCIFYTHLLLNVLVCQPNFIFFCTGLLDTLHGSLKQDCSLLNPNLSLLIHGKHLGCEDRDRDSQQCKITQILVRILASVGGPFVGGELKAIAVERLP